MIKIIKFYLSAVNILLFTLVLRKELKRSRKKRALI